MEKQHEMWAVVGSSSIVDDTHEHRYPSQTGTQYGLGICGCWMSTANVDTGTAAAAAMAKQNEMWTAVVDSSSMVDDAHEHCYVHRPSAAVRLCCANRGGICLDFAATESRGGLRRRKAAREEKGLTGSCTPGALLSRTLTPPRRLVSSRLMIRQTLPQRQTVAVTPPPLPTRARRAEVAPEGGLSAGTAARSSGMVYNSDSSLLRRLRRIPLPRSVRLLLPSPATTTTTC